MKTYDITNVKAFMSSLLMKDTFDDFIVKSVDIATFTNFSIDCAFNKDFYTKEELEDGISTDISWGQVKNVCYNLIKGNKLPLSFKIVLSGNSDCVRQILDSSALNYNESNITGLYLNIKYSSNTLTIVSGTSMNIFTMDKTIENLWDNYLNNFLNEWS